MAIRPLLSFYGVVSLSRGLTLMRQKSLRESALTASHGFRQVDWNAELRNEKGPNFANLRIAVTSGGSFVDLMNATKNESQLKNNSSRPNHTHKAMGPEEGDTYQLDELVGAVPKLCKKALDWIGEPRCIPISPKKAGRETKIIKLAVAKYHFGDLTREAAISIFASTDFCLVDESENEIVFEGPNDTSKLPPLTDALGNWEIGDLWLYRKFANGSALSKIGLLYGISYALGMLVRYFPTQWTAILRSQIGDAALPTLLAAGELIETDYPQVVVDHLLDRS